MKSSAGKLGKWLEDRVIDTIEETLGQTITRFKYTEFLTKSKEELPNTFIVKGFPITRYWEMAGFIPKRAIGGRTEFVLFHKKLDSYMKMRLECKNQDVAGTTYDKLAMAILDMNCCRPSDEHMDIAYIIVSGKELERRLDAIKFMVNDLASKTLNKSITKAVSLQEFSREIKTILLS